MPERAHIFCAASHIKRVEEIAAALAQGDHTLDVTAHTLAAALCLVDTLPYSGINVTLIGDELSKIHREGRAQRAFIRKVRRKVPEMKIVALAQEDISGADAVLRPSELESLNQAITKL